MAISKESLLEILAKEAEADAKADELNTLFESQINAVLLNKEEILKEKREEAAKRKAAEEASVDLKAQIEKLNEQLKAQSPDEVKKVYEQQLSDAAVVYEKKLAEANENLEVYKKRTADLEHAQLKLECMQEFNKAIAGKNIATDSINDFADFVLGFDCSKFEHRPIGEGKTILATKDGLTIQQAVNAGCETTFGKNCMRVNSTGGGAEVGTSGFAPITDNPFKKETLNLSKQSELFRTDPALAAKLKAAAEK